LKIWRKKFDNQLRFDEVTATSSGPVFGTPCRYQAG